MAKMLENANNFKIKCRYIEIGHNITQHTGF